jgi:hypothetical protein
MVVVFHDANSKANDLEIRANFIEYGRRLDNLIQEIKADLARKSATPATVVG